MTDETLLFVVVVAVGAVAIFFIAFFLVIWTIDGASVLFLFAADQGFVGITAYIFAWVLLFPIMLIGSIFFGFICWLHLRAAKREANYESRRKPNEPPMDWSENYKWANRLPPYDKDE